MYDTPIIFLLFLWILHIQSCSQYLMSRLNNNKPNMTNIIENWFRERNMKTIRMHSKKSIITKNRIFVQINVRSQSFSFISNAIQNVVAGCCLQNINYIACKSSRALRKPYSGKQNHWHSNIFMTILQLRNS